MPPNPQTSSRPPDLKVSVLKLAADWNAKSKPRHHIFLFDGTWNDVTGINPANFKWDDSRHVWVSVADPTKAYPPVVTNVAKSYAALAPDGATQLTHYF